MFTQDFSSLTAVGRTKQLKIGYSRELGSLKCVVTADVIPGIELETHWGRKTLTLRKRRINAD